MGHPTKSTATLVALRLPRSLHTALKNRAAALDRSVSEHIRALIEADLYGHEHLVSNAQTAARMSVVSAIFMRRILDGLIGEEKALALQKYAFEQAEDAAK